MKSRMVAAIAMACLMAAVASAQNIALSAFSGDEKILARLGIETQQKFEIGLQVEGDTKNNFWEQDCTWENTLVGGYADFKIDLGGSWNIYPVVGAQGSIDADDTSGYLFGPEAGFRVDLHDNIAVGALCQYRWHKRDLSCKREDGFVWLVGARVRF